MKGTALAADREKRRYRRRAVPGVSLRRCAAAGDEASRAVKEGFCLTAARVPGAVSAGEFPAAGAAAGTRAAAQVLAGMPRPRMQELDEQDRADVQAALDGAEDAYAGIVERHNVAVQKQMRNFSRDPAVIEELTQDVFVEAYLSLAGFRGDAPFRHWLARIATLTGYKYWKKRGKDRKTVPLADGMEPAAKEAAETGDPEEAAALLFDLLQTLPADDRLAMTLMYLENLTQDEIASRMGWTRVTVAVRIYRAKQRLRKLGDKEPWKGRLQWMTS